MVHSICHLPHMSNALVVRDAVSAEAMIPHDREKATETNGFPGSCYRERFSEPEARRTLGEGTHLHPTLMARGTRAEMPLIER